MGSQVYSLLDFVIAGQTTAAKLDRLASLGFNGIEVSYGLAGVDPDGLRGACDQRAIVIVDVTGVWLADGVSADSEARARQWQIHAENVRLAARLGCARYIVVDHIPKPIDVPTALARSWLVVALRELGEVARPLEVTILVEPLARKFQPVIATVADAIALCEDVGHPNVRLMLDSYHMAYNGEDFTTAIQPAMPFCGHVHCSDYVPGARTPVTERPMPGEGTIDFAAFLTPIAAAGYSGPIGFEALGALERPDLTVRARELVERILADSRARI